MARPFESIPHTCEVERFGAGALDLLVEVPHGATRAEHFDVLRARLKGPYPDDLRDYFFVNTDVGAPEVARRAAEILVEAHPSRSVLVVRSLVPRTFVDCNRIVDASTAPKASAAGEMTPGIGSYVKDPADVRTLVDLHARYREVVERAFETVCGAGGDALMLHTYAPREVDVPVDDRIVERLREAYAADRVGTWPLRAEADCITKTPDGHRLADETTIARVRAAMARVGVRCAVDATYALHPSTMGHRYAARWPGRTLCLEVRRDLLMQAFTPFAEMDVDPENVELVASALAEAFS